MQNKTLKIIVISTLVLIILASVAYLFIKKNEQKTPATNEQKSFNEGVASRSTNNLPINSEINNDNGYQTEETSDTKTNQIKTNIENWQQNKDQESLIKAISETRSDSEETYELWLDLVKNHSKELVLISSKIQNKETLANLIYIYDWFVNLSGEYNKFSPEEKQIFLRDYMQIDIFFKQLSQ